MGLVATALRLKFFFAEQEEEEDAGMQLAQLVETAVTTGLAVAAEAEP